MGMLGDQTIRENIDEGLERHSLDNLKKQKNSQTSNDPNTISFNADGFMEIPKDVVVAMMDEMIKVSELRRSKPNEAWDNIPYVHRINAAMINNYYSLSLGDSTFTLPPQAISITSECKSQEIITLRQENTTKEKTGYARRTISIELVFHGDDMINGYAVDGPEGTYYVDGLRSLLAQFKCTPFLPIQNYTINVTYGISTVALQSIICSTVEGFPDMMLASLTLLEVDMYPYIEQHSSYFPYMIDWDLFRFYYQRLLTETHELNKLQSIPDDKHNYRFTMSLLNEDIFDGSIDYNYDNNGTIKIKGSKNTESYSFYDIVTDKKIVYRDEDGTIKITDPTVEHPTNYITKVDVRDEIKISSFQCGYSNVLTTMQLAAAERPTIQYMGGIDTMFNITFETYNPDIITALEDCNVENNKMVRNHKDCASIGFIKLDNELVQLFGSQFVMIDTTATHTVPDFPGLFVCQISCVSFDINQKDKEGITGLNPFENDRDGTKDDAITQDISGLYKKISQDTNVEQKIRNKTNLYPDLRLPTYEEVDEVIKKITDFRQEMSKELGTDIITPYHLAHKKYPRNLQSSVEGITRLEGIKENGQGIITNLPDILNNETSLLYNGYVDPDFYVFYPYRYSEIYDEEENKDFFYTQNPKSVKSTQSMVQHTENSTNANISSYNYSGHDTDLSGIRKSFVAAINQKCGKGFTNDTDKRFGPEAYNPSGLIGACLNELGVIDSPNITCESVAQLLSDGVLETIWETSSTDNKSELMAHITIGDILHIYANEKQSTMGMMAVYIGNNKIVYANSSQRKVCEENIYESNQKFRRILGIKQKEKEEEEPEYGKEEGQSTVTATIQSSGTYPTISEDEINLIARTIMNVSNNNAACQGHLAQMIYDMVTDPQAKYGNLNNILSLQSLFPKGAMTNEYQPAFYANAEAVVKATFVNGARVSNTRILMYTSLDMNNANKETINMRGFSEICTIDDCTFYSDGKATSNKEYDIGAPCSNENVTTIYNQDLKLTRLDRKAIKHFGKPILMNVAGGLKETSYTYLIPDTSLEYKYAKKHTEDNGKIENFHSFNSSWQTLLSSFVNQCQYASKGRLNRAFPTYLFSIVDEDGHWLDGRKLWSNYYLLRSLIEIEVVSNNDSPVDTATIVVANNYSNLDTLPPNAHYYDPAKDGEYNRFQRWMLEKFGMLPSLGPKLTQTLVDMKNIIYKSMVLRAGCRVHLRMGYGSDPLMLPVVLNGFLSDVSLGDVVTLVCVSDGEEYLNNLLSSRDGDENNTGGIGQESSNICMNILAHRESGFLNAVNSKWGEPSGFGIENSGLYFTGHVDLGDTDSDFLNFFIGVGEAVTTALKKVGDAFSPLLRDVQYDLCKNIYRTSVEGVFFTGSYEASLAMYSYQRIPFLSAIFPIDYEDNIQFNMYNKTPWDAFQYAAMNAPEFIAHPRYHQFESRLYLGTPYFLYRYRYNKVQTSNGGRIYDECKTFSQTHYIDSFTDIIDNQIDTSYKDIYTNAIVMYTRGSSLVATPTLYSDRTIPVSYQSTKIFDTSVTQDWFGPDLLYSIFFTPGKDAAIRVGESQLMYNWEKAYTGEIITIGDPGIFPHDLIYLSDRFNDLSGVCKVRSVYHKLSFRTGFITCTTPGMVSICTLAPSDSIFHYINVMQVCSGFSEASSIKEQIYNNINAMKSDMSIIRGAVFLKKTLSFVAIVGSMALGVKYSAKIVELLRTIKNVSKTTKAARMLKKAIDAIQKFDKVKDAIDAIRKMVQARNAFVAIKNFIDGVKLGYQGLQLGTEIGATAAGVAVGSAAGSIAPGIGNVIGAVVGLIIGKIIDAIFTKIIDWFMYKNCIMLLPLIHKGSPYCPIVKGEKLILYSAGDNVSEESHDVYDDEKYIPGGD